ncbi:MAG TPA: outer membrane beta-barrel protein, partial [Chthoniobacterales bacterium]|nr:outer membrane beta-barrel protein [Chthoniobacterales bacterium]
PYVTGGLAVGDLDYAQEIDFPPHVVGDFEGGREQQTNAGWIVGGGLQYALTEHWSLRTQYQFIDLGDVDFTSDFGLGGGAPAHHQADLREHNASFAIVYKF